MSKKILFTSVCRPLGPDYGDAPSVGYELLYGQVTRAQGLFSPRALHLHFSMEYIAENLETPAVVLQYPSRAELIRELKKGYDFVGVSFLLAVFHRMKDVVALIRKYSPASKIILGGYGTVLSDEILKPYSDYICREEGVGFMRRLLEEPEIPMPYRHPLIVSRLKIFSKEISQTGMVFAGLGCPNGCDFCCTSYFFKRKHVRLLPTGKDIYNVIEGYLELNPRMSLVVLDEDFLLNKKRALELRECVKAGGKTFSMFVFSSVKAISQYTVEEILEMGIDGFWIGYEGTRSGFGKQMGRPTDELFREFREHGITILASMIVGFPYQTPEIVEEEFNGLMALKPTLGQFLIYGPTPGTPFYDRIMKEGLLHKDLTDDREKYYRSCTGFKAMVQHPNLKPQEIEALQNRCFKEDFQRLGPSIYRSIETYFLGYKKLKNSMDPQFQSKAKWFAVEIRKAYPVFLAGRIWGPNGTVRKWIAQLENEIYASLGEPSLKERLLSFGALAAATWTGIKLKLNIFQHPSLVRHVYRWPEEAPKPARAWRHLSQLGLPLSVELRQEDTIWIRFEKLINEVEAKRLGAHLQDVLRKKRERLVVDLENLVHLSQESAHHLASNLEEFRHRVRLIIPSAFVDAETAAPLAIFGLHR